MSQSMATTACTLNKTTKTRAAKKNKALLTVVRFFDKMSMMQLFDGKKKMETAVAVVSKIFKMLR
jgi:hypothetical protein